MGVTDVVVVAGALVLLAGLGWFFFGPRRVRAAHLEAGVQRVGVTVAGGYRPDVIRVRQGVPVELVFDRQEAGDCTSRVVFADFGVSASLPAHQRTTVRLEPADVGSFGFACGMGMVRGTMVVEAARGTDTAELSVRPGNCGKSRGIHQVGPMVPGPGTRTVATWAR